jgi:hypothetical protein
LNRVVTARSFAGIAIRRARAAAAAAEVHADAAGNKFGSGERIAHQTRFHPKLESTALNNVVDFGQIIVFAVNLRELRL